MLSTVPHVYRSYDYAQIAPASMEAYLLTLPARYSTQSTRPPPTFHSSPITFWNSSCVKPGGRRRISSFKRGFGVCGCLAAAGTGRTPLVVLFEDVFGLRAMIVGPFGGIVASEVRVCARDWQSIKYLVICFHQMDGDVTCSGGRFGSGPPRQANDVSNERNINTTYPELENDI